MYINFRSQNSYFFSYMDTCIAIIMYCQSYFCCLLVNNIFYINNFGGNLPAMHISVCMQNFKFGGVTVLAVQLFNKIKQKEKKTKNLKKHVSLCFQDVMSKYIYIW